MEVTAPWIQSKLKPRTRYIRVGAPLSIEQRWQNAFYRVLQISWINLASRGQCATVSTSNKINFHIVGSPWQGGSFVYQRSLLNDAERLCKSTCSIKACSALDSVDSLQNQFANRQCSTASVTVRPIQVHKFDEKGFVSLILKCLGSKIERLSWWHDVRSNINARRSGMIMRSKILSWYHVQCCFDTVKVMNS